MPPKGVFFRGRGKGQKGGQKGGRKGGQQSITNFVVASPAAAVEEEQQRPAKRQRTSTSSETSDRLENDSQQHEQQQQQRRPQDETEPGQQSAQAAAPSSGAPRRPISTAAKTPADKAAFQRRLLGSGPAAAGGSAAAAAAAPIEPGADGSAPQKLTPLEQQIVALKRQHPGVMLIVEVGYKAKLFGEDAVVGELGAGLGMWAAADGSCRTGLTVALVRTHTAHSACDRWIRPAVPCSLPRPAHVYLAGPQLSHDLGG